MVCFSYYTGSNLQKVSVYTLQTSARRLTCNKANIAVITLQTTKPLNIKAKNKNKIIYHHTYVCYIKKAFKGQCFTINFKCTDLYRAIKSVERFSIVAS